MLPGVYKASKKDGTVYYRASITYRNKHISLGSFALEEDASRAYFMAEQLLGSKLSIEDAFYMTRYLPFEKIVILCNFRDNGMYISTPIYLRKNYFSYYLSIQKELKFDIDDLFYYSGKKIMQRRGHLFVNDYGMQITILSRYGIKPHAVLGRDYEYANGDSTDMRYSNVIVINPYFGVTRTGNAGNYKYKSILHIKGNCIIGVYDTIEDAAIAYNKAIDLAKDVGISKNYTKNFIDSLSVKDYKQKYSEIEIRKSFYQYLTTYC